MRMVVYSSGNRQRGGGKPFLSPSGLGRGLRGVSVGVGVLWLLHPQTRHEAKPSLTVPKPPSCAPARAAVVRAVFGGEDAWDAPSAATAPAGSTTR